MASYTETFTMNGTDTSVSVAHAIAFAPTVTLNSVAQTVYQSGVDPWGQNGWYWDSGTALLYQGAAIAPAAATTLEVVYETQNSNSATATEPTEQSARASAWRSGIVEIAVPARGTTTSDEVQQIAQAALRRTGTVVKTPQLTSREPFFNPGESMSCIDSRFELNGAYLISSVSLSLPGGGPADLGYGTAFERSVELMEIATMTPQSPAAPDAGAIASGPQVWQSSFLALSGSSGGGGVVAPPVVQQERVPFVLGLDSDFVGGLGTSNTYPVINACSAVRVVVTCQIPPVGQKLVIDIKRNGTSIFSTVLGRPTINPTDTFTEWVKFIGYNSNPALNVPYRFAANDILQAFGTYVTSSTTVTAAQDLTIILVTAY